MADKKTIIDGIDVSGCEHCVKMTKYRCIIQRDVYKYLCEENPNCYYKQLKRKEQECEKLNKQVNDLLNKPEIQDKILWKIDNEALLRSKDAWIYKLEQTLTEIKEITDIIGDKQMPLSKDMTIQK